jgi:RNA polymerase sigma factor (TIGR02999 family)
MDMNSDDAGTITFLLQKVAGGDLLAKDKLYRTLYGQLSRIARNRLARTGAVSLDAPAILHESYMRIEGSRSEGGFPNRKAFFTYASAVIRTVIIDYVRERQAKKRGANQITSLNTGVGEVVVDEQTLLELNQAMADLERLDPRCHQVVEMRYFGGLTDAETAELLGVSVPTVRRDWYKARAYLFKYLQGPA